MYHVLLVEPDKDLCRHLSAAISGAGCGTTIVRTVDEATAALSSLDKVDHLVIQALLPDGSGLVLAEGARRLGKLVHVLRKRRGRIVVYDDEGTLFLGNRSDAAAFLAETVLRAEEKQSVDLAKPASEPRRTPAKQQQKQRPPTPARGGHRGQHPEETGMSHAPAPQSRDGYRPCVGIVLLNRRGEVLVARRGDVAGEAWQMPQGGIDEGEEPRAAAMRELKEEIGTDRADILAESKSWLSYDLPPELAEKARHLGWRGQRQKWFVMRFVGTDDEIHLTAEHAEFDAWKWVAARELPDLIVSFKRQVYIDLLTEFPELTKVP